VDSSHVSDAEEASVGPDRTGAAAQDQLDASVAARALRGGAVSPRAVLALQRAAGNRATAAFVQPRRGGSPGRALQRQSVPQPSSPGPGVPDELTALRYGDSDQILRQLRLV